MKALIFQGLALVGALILSACAIGPRARPKVETSPVTALPSTSKRTQTKQYRPKFAAAKRYGIHRLVKGGDGPELQAWRRAFGRHGYVVEVGLSRVASDALSILARQEALVPALREGLMEWHGQTSVDVSFSRLMGKVEPSQAAEHVARMVKKNLASASDASRLGLALARQGERIELVVVQARPRVELLAFDREMSLGERIELRGQLLSDRSDPVMMILDPQGHGRVVPLRERNGRVFGSLACDRGPGRYQVEWVAKGRLGPEVVLNVPVYCAASAPDLLSYRARAFRSFASVQAIERESWALVNRVRESQGLASLRWDASLAELARTHSRDMERLDYVGHRSPGQGGFDTRLEGAGIDAPLALENVASGVGPQEILDRLMVSPGHRFNILNPEVTHLGVGVAIRTTLGPQGQDTLFLTQHFARWEERERKGDRLRTPVSLLTPR